MHRLLFVFLILFQFAVHAEETAEPKQWSSKTLFYKVKDGKLLGLLNEITDTGLKKVIAYDLHKNDRSYYVFTNNGRPYFEVWDFPKGCGDEGCRDSQSARISIVPYGGEKFHGEIRWTTTGDNKVQFYASEGLLLEIDLNTMEVSDGLFNVDLTIPPKIKTDPAVKCVKEITCLRSLAFGRLPFEALGENDLSEVFWRGGEKQIVRNQDVYFRLNEVESRKDIRVGLKALTEDELAEITKKGQSNRLAPKKTYREF